MPPSNPGKSRSHSWQASNTTQRVVAKRPPPAFSSAPARAAITVNHREFDKYFTTDALRTVVRRPLLLTETGEKFDILATVDGGGVNGQAGAVRLAVARALVEYNAELRKQLKKDGLLTSDSRVKERKKYGLAGARKRFQFSKR
jgi:small subunit ribosomal protein S9